MSEYIEAVIFDLDGVIVSTDQFHYQAWKKIADNKGIYFDKKINDRLRGVSRRESLEIILQNSKVLIPEAEKEILMEQKNNIYRELLSKMTQQDVSKDVYDTLKELKRLGYRIAIGSSSKNAGLILSKVGLKNSFDAIIDGNCIHASKPDPEVFLLAAHALRVCPEKCMVVEDAKSGIQAAKRAHMVAAGIGNAASYDKTDYKIRTLSDILRLLAS